MNTNNDFFKLAEGFDFNGVSFVSIKGYCSDQSANTEVADILINVGSSYANMKEADLATLKAANASELANDNFGVALIQEAIDEKIKSILAPSKARSEAQTEAYVALNKKGTLKLCKETRSIVIAGTVVRKTVIVEGAYKEVKSKPLTLAKKYLDKALNLKMAKLRNYKLSNIIQSVKVNGDTIEIG